MKRQSTAALAAQNGTALTDQERIAALQAAVDCQEAYIQFLLGRRQNCRPVTTLVILIRLMHGVFQKYRRACNALGLTLAGRGGELRGTLGAHLADLQYQLAETRRDRQSCMKRAAKK